MTLERKETNAPRTLVTSNPRLDHSNTVNVGMRVGSLAGPVEPRLPIRIPGFEDQSPTRRQCRADATKCRAPFVLGEEDLSNIASHGRQVNGERRQPHCIADNPPDPVSASHAPGDVKGCTCWVYANDPKPATRQRANVPVPQPM